MSSRFLIAVVGSLLGGCMATAAVPPVLTPAGQSVLTGKGDPSTPMRELGPITASDGDGCGWMGSRGSFEGAMVQLKNYAASIGASYVQIYSMTDPHFSPGCFDNHFTVYGMAYRAGNAAGPETSTPAAPPAPAAAAPPPPADPAQRNAIVETACEVRSAPSTVAPTVFRVWEGDRIVVTNPGVNGWRFAKLADGRGGYLTEAAVRLEN